MSMFDIIRLSIAFCDLVGSCMALYSLFMVSYGILWSFLSEFRNQRMNSLLEHIGKLFIRLLNLSDECYAFYEALTEKRTKFMAMHSLVNTPKQWAHANLRFACTGGRYYFSTMEYSSDFKVAF